MAKFLFVLGTGMENPSRPTRCMQLAKVAHEEGHEVHIFLVDNAVFFGKEGMTENIVAPTGDEMDDHMQAIIGAKVPVYV